MLIMVHGRLSICTKARLREGQSFNLMSLIATIGEHWLRSLLLDVHVGHLRVMVAICVVRRMLAAVQQVLVLML